MMQSDYRIEDDVMKTTEKMTLWKADQGFVEIEKDSLAAPVKRGDEVKGYVFQGKARLALDTIIETDNGAIGETTEKDLSEPFLMLGQTEHVQEHLLPATNEDLTNRNHKDSKDFIEYAGQMLHGLIGRRVQDSCWSEPEGCVFAFANRESRTDILVAEHDRIVYKSRDLTYVSNGHGVIMKKPEHGLVMKHDHCCIIRDFH